MAPADRSIGELAAQVEKYELKSTLSAEEFDTYCGFEVALEAHLFEAAAVFARNLDFEKARGALQQVVTMNKSLRSIVERELRRTRDRALRKRLSNARDAASGLILVVQGQIFESHADEKLLANELQPAVANMEKAREYFSRLSGEPLPQADFGEPAARHAAAKIEFFKASMALRRGAYEQAHEGFRSVHAQYGYLLEEAEKAVEDPRVARLFAQFAREFLDQLNLTRVMLNYSNFFCQVLAGNCYNAVQYAGDAVSLYETWLQSAISNELPVQLQNIRRMELEYFRGWLAWAKAEDAVENRRWDECIRHVTQARQSWFHSTDMALRHALRGLMSPQYETAHTEMLLRSTERRCQREKALYEEIHQMRVEKSQVNGVIINNPGANYMSNESSFKFEGNVNAGVIGNNATANINQVGGDQITAKMDNLATELAQLREVMSTGAKTEAEKAALEHVTSAEAEARRGNEEGVKHHLAAAGRWVLSLVEKLSLPVAEAVIKASIAP
jgi:hypothetical protein